MRDKTDTTREVLLNLTPQDFLSFGMHDIAYIRPVVIEGKKAYAVHAANGIPLSVMEDMDRALGAVADNDLHATALH